MRIDILTVMPDALELPLHTSILQRAQDKGLVEIHVHNLRTGACASIARSMTTPSAARQAW